MLGFCVAVRIKVCVEMAIFTKCTAQVPGFGAVGLGFDAQIQTRGSIKKY